MSALDLRLLHLINVPAFHGHSVFQVRLCSKSRNYKPINIYFYQYFRIRAVAIFDAAHIVFDRTNRQCVPLRGRIFSSGDHVRSFSTLICVKCLASGFFLPYSLWSIFFSAVWQADYAPGKFSDRLWNKL